jgi:hypothetical protein
MTDGVRRSLPVLGSYAWGPEGSQWRLDSLPPEQRAVAEDYRLLEYDVLFGKRYVMGDRH